MAKRLDFLSSKKSSEKSSRLARALASGYWQVPLKEEDRQKTAFSTHTSLWEFTVMPFGLCGPPASFQRLMEIMLAGLNREACLVYSNDIIIFARTFEECLSRLESVLSRLRTCSLKLKVKKCTFAHQKLSI